MNETPREAAECEALATVEQYTAWCMFNQFDKAAGLLAPDVLIVDERGTLWRGRPRWRLEQAGAWVPGRNFDVLRHEVNGSRVVQVGLLSDDELVHAGLGPLNGTVEFIVHQGRIIAMIETLTPYALARTESVREHAEVIRIA